MNIAVDSDNRTPIIACNLYVLFHDMHTAKAFCQQLRLLNCRNELKSCITSNEVRVKIASLPASEFWELADALTEMFHQIKDQYSELKRIIDDLQGDCFVDIECHKMSAYPSMLFDGDVMRTIHELKADISIDMYDA